nr:DUF3298 domain-containing protein [Williamsia sp. CHRR-6]
MNTTSTRAGAALVVGLLLLAATGCATDSTPRSIAPKTSVLTLTSIVPRSVAPRGVEASTAASSAPPAQAGLPYVVRPTRLRGGDSRSITYDITIPQVSGGSPAVAGEFNESMRAAVEGITDPTRADRGDAQNQPGDFTVHIGRRVISSQLLVYFVPIPVPAHGGTLISTVTVDADTARPITVSDLFPDLRAGLTRLSGVAAELVPRTRAGVGYERRGDRTARGELRQLDRLTAGHADSFPGLSAGRICAGPHRHHHPLGTPGRRAGARDAGGGV